MTYKILVNTLACFSLAFALTACSGGGGSDEVSKLKAENESLKETAKKDSLYVASMSTEMDQLYKSIDEMRATEDKIKQATSRLQSGALGGAEGSLTIDEGIAALEKKLAENQQRISSLQSKLGKSEKENGMLKKMVEELNKTVQDRDKMISDLKLQVTDLQAEVADFKSKYSMSEAEKKDAQEALNVANDVISTTFYTIGTKKELKNRNVIITKGLMGNVAGIQPDVDESKMTKVDARYQDKIKVAKVEKKQEASDITIFPAPPAGSYEITQENGEWVINIKNKNFWKSKYTAIILDF
ncbi:MAG: hypothetical protein EAZ97_09610 [Bacteroidetes bacterium]|nr:MAG: hypothetical protein EAZ97_09610 [Bacteroidota bacterium]